MSNGALTHSGAKFREAIAKLALYDFRAERWVHLRTTNPIESTFAAVCNRSKITKGREHAPRESPASVAPPRKIRPEFAAALRSRAPLIERPPLRRGPCARAGTAPETAVPDR